MKISDYFNETELTIFYRQTHFTFGDFYRSSDGTLTAVDRQSGQVFIGQDLFRSNLHDLSSITSVVIEDGGAVLISFGDSSSVRIQAGVDDAVAIASELAPDPQAVTVEEDVDDPVQAEPDDPAVEAEEAPDSVILPGFLGTMDKKAMLDFVRGLERGTLLHVRYNPLIGRMRDYEAEFVKTVVEVRSQKNFSLYASSSRYENLLDEVMRDLFNYVSIIVETPEKEIRCKLKRVVELSRSQKEKQPTSSEVSR